MASKAAHSLPFDADSEEVPTTPTRTRKRGNDLDGKTWTQYSISVWNDIRKTRDELELKHPAMFPKMLAERLIQIFTKSDQKRVFDPFMGVGSTLLAAKALDREGIGIEISKQYAVLAQQRLSEQMEIFSEAGPRQRVINDDAFNMRKHITDESIDIIITSPPYWDILSERRSVDTKAVRDYEEQEHNLGAIHNYRKFIEALKALFTETYHVLKSNCYCIVVVMDIRKKDKFYPFHIDIINFMEDIGFIHDDIIIWDRRSEYNNLKPIGFPAVFRVNKIHEYILIFKKPRVDAAP